MSSGGKNRKSEIGKRYGKLVVIESDVSTIRGLAVWKCRCDCTNEVSVRGFDLRQGRRKSCGCLQHRNKRGSASPLWSGYKDISGAFWHRLCHNAKTRNLEMTISKESVWELYEKQNRKCALSGIDITFDPSDLNAKIKGSQTASVDRLDNSKGYVDGNVQLVHKDVNFMRQAMSVNEFVMWCRRISNNHEPSKSE